MVQKWFGGFNGPDWSRLVQIGGLESGPIWSPEPGNLDQSGPAPPAGAKVQKWLAFFGFRDGSRSETREKMMVRLGSVGVRTGRVRFGMVRAATQRGWGGHPWWFLSVNPSGPR